MSGMRQFAHNGGVVNYDKGGLEVFLIGKGANGFSYNEGLNGARRNNLFRELSRIG